jgi:flagellar basal body-associated protein FliL
MADLAPTTGKMKTGKIVIIVVAVIIVIGVAYYYFGVYLPKKKQLAATPGTPEHQAAVQTAAQTQVTA